MRSYIFFLFFCFPILSSPLFEPSLQCVPHDGHRVLEFKEENLKIKILPPKDAPEPVEGEICETRQGRVQISLLDSEKTPQTSFPCGRRECQFNLTYRVGNCEPEIQFSREAADIERRIELEAYEFSFYLQNYLRDSRFSQWIDDSADLYRYPFYELNYRLTNMMGPHSGQCDDTLQPENLFIATCEIKPGTTEKIIFSDSQPSIDLFRELLSLQRRANFMECSFLYDVVKPDKTHREEACSRVHALMKTDLTRRKLHEWANREMTQNADGTKCYLDLCDELGWLGSNYCRIPADEDCNTISDPSKPISLLRKIAAWTAAALFFCPVTMAALVLSER